MKKLLMSAIGALALFLLPAKAIPYIDLNLEGIVFAPGAAGVDTYTNSFDITPFGYDPLTQQVNSALATFTFIDPLELRASESISIDLGGELFATSGSFQLLLVLPGGITGEALLDLSDDGIVSYTIERGSGDFKLVSSLLIADAGPRGVPDDGSTFAFMGTALLGLAVFGGRRMLV